MTRGAPGHLEVVGEGTGGLKLAWLMAASFPQQPSTQPASPGPCPIAMQEAASRAHGQGTIQTEAGRDPDCSPGLFSASQRC